MREITSFSELNMRELPHAEVFLMLVSFLQVKDERRRMFIKMTRKGGSVNEKSR